MVNVEEVKVSIEVEVLLLSGRDRVEITGVLGEYMLRFKKSLERLLTRNFSLICRGTSDYDVLAYAVVTNEIVKKLSGSLSETELQIASSIDLDLGLPDYVSASRHSPMLTSHYAWRRGEPLVDLGLETTFRLRSFRVVSELSQPFLSVSKEAVSHLVGRSAVILARAVMGGDVEEVRRVVRFINGLWYSVYGLKAPCGGEVSVYVPGLNKVYCAELEVIPRTS
jgi:hypothetical protein